MKIIVSIFFLIVFFEYSYSQNSYVIESESLKNRNLKVLYKGPNNQIKIIIKDTLSDYFLMSKCFTIESLNDSIYFIKVKSFCEKYKLNIYKINEDNDTLLFDSIFYEVKNFADPITEFGNISKDCTKQELLQQREVRVRIIDSLWNDTSKIAFDVKSGKIKFIKNKEEIITSLSFDGKLSSNQLEILNELDVGDSIEIYDISAIAFNGRIIRASQLKINILNK